MASFLAKYRNNVEIIADMLLITREGALKTQIMYGGNLSFKLTERYLNDILKAGLAVINGEGRYLITRKGTMFLKKFVSYKRHASNLRKQLTRVRDEKAVLEKLSSLQDLPNGYCANNIAEAGNKRKPRVLTV